MPDTLMGTLKQPVNCYKITSKCGRFYVVKKRLEDDIENHRYISINDRHSIKWLVATYATSKEGEIIDRMVHGNAPLPIYKVTIDNKKSAMLWMLKIPVAKTVNGSSKAEIYLRDAFRKFCKHYKLKTAINILRYINPLYKNWGMQKVGEEGYDICNFDNTINKNMYLYGDNLRTDEYLNVRQYLFITSMRDIYRIAQGKEIENLRNFDECYGWVVDHLRSIDVSAYKPIIEQNVYSDLAKYIAKFLSVKYADTLSKYRNERKRTSSLASFKRTYEKQMECSRLFDKGLNNVLIAKHLGIRRATVIKWLKILGKYADYDVEYIQ